MKEIDWESPPFDEILREWKAVFEKELARRAMHRAHENGGFLITAFEGRFSSLSEKQERMFGDGLNFYAKIKELVDARDNSRQ